MIQEQEKLWSQISSWGWLKKASVSEDLQIGILSLPVSETQQKMENLKEN
jgi:hypothetical protein